MTRDAIIRNLALVIAVGGADDLRETYRLIEVLGEAHLARVHHESGLNRAGHRDWNLTTEAAVSLANVDHSIAVLVADGMTAEEAERIARALARQAGWLLLTALESDRRMSRPAEFVDWVEELADVVAEPWLPVSSGLSTQLDDFPEVTRAVDELRLVAQQCEADRDRLAVAAEIRRIVAASGLSQRAFAHRIGTSPSRLSTYLSGRVVPSAAMMVRVKRLEQNLRVEQSAHTRTDIESHAS